MKTQLNVRTAVGKVVESIKAVSGHFFMFLSDDTYFCIIPRELGVSMIRFSPWDHTDIALEAGVITKEDLEKYEQDPVIKELNIELAGVTEESKKFYELYSQAFSKMRSLQHKLELLNRSRGKE